MKIQPRKQLDPADLLPYKPGRAGLKAPATAFQLKPADLTPSKPGLSSKAASPAPDVTPKPLDVPPFRAGHPDFSGPRNVRLDQKPIPAGAKSEHDQLS